MSDQVADVLNRIVDRRRQSLGKEGYQLGPLSASDGSSGPELARDAPGRLFLDALSADRGNAIIAEVKMGSPKLGDLRGRVDPARQAATYQNGGAAALSVVVEPDFFFGSYALLEQCRRASELPAIAKDFVVSEQQFRWARDAGANAVLLIAALYESTELADYTAAAHALGLVPLVETHSEGDLAKLRELERIRFDLVGVNNRDLRTFAVDIENSIRLRPQLPPESMAVAESGISSRADIERLSAAGFDAFLIGESLLLADDPGAQLAALKGSASAEGSA